MNVFSASLLPSLICLCRYGHDASLVHFRSPLRSWLPHLQCKPPSIEHTHFPLASFLAHINLPHTTLSCSQQSARREAAPAYDVAVNDDHLHVTRKGENSPIFDVNLATLTYEDQHIHVDIIVGAGAMLYGLGEHLTEKYVVRLRSDCLSVEALFESLPRGLLCLWSRSPTS